MRKGDYGRAILDFTKAIEKDPIDPSSYYERSSSYYEQGDYDRAIANLTVVIHLTADATVYYKRGLMRGIKGEHNRAINELYQSYTTEP